MTTAPEQRGTPRALRTYLGALSAAALLLVVWLCALAVGQPWDPLVVPVTVLVCAGHVCLLWAADRAQDPQSFDASEVGFVVAVVLLPLPVALLVTVLAGLVTVLVEFRRAAERLRFNAAVVVIHASAAGAVVWALGPAPTWAPLAAAGGWLLVDQLLAHPLVVGAVALADDRRPAWPELLLARDPSSWAVTLPTALVGVAAGYFAQTSGSAGVWWAAGSLVAVAVASRARLGAWEEVRRLQRVLRVMGVPATGRGPAQVLVTLDDALYEVAGVRGVSVATTTADAPADLLAQPLPAAVGGAHRRLVVGRPLETGPVYARRQDAVLQLLAAGAEAYALAETTHALRRDAHHDGLTGVLNRAGFLAHAELELARARRSHLSAVVVYIDLDGFKAVNDSLGHEAGDRALQATAVELRELIRPHDVVARLGGDEFVLLLLDLPACEQGGAVVERVHERMASGWPVFPGAHRRLYGSVGTACFPTEGEDVAALLRRADEQMYLRKRERR